MRRASLIAVVVLAVGALARAPVHADELDLYLERQRQVYQIPAIVVGIFRADRVVFENMSRVIAFEFDEQGRIKSIRSEDE